MEKYLQSLIEIVKKAGNIMLEASSIASSVTEKDGSANFVTEYDVRVQEYLKAEIEKTVENAVFIAEEQENDPALLMSENCFIIDPIDGTTNFIRDQKHSCISVAMLGKGEVQLGIVYDPYLGEVFSAVNGKGAFLNGKPMHVSKTELERAICGYGTAPYYKNTLGDKTFNICKKLFMKCADVRRCGSAALDLAYIAAGRYDMFFECRLSPWDYAAGILLVTEAGGMISDMQGKRLSLEKPCSVIASNEILYQELVLAVTGEM